MSSHYHFAIFLAITGNILNLFVFMKFCYIYYFIFSDEVLGSQTPKPQFGSSALFGLNIAGFVNTTPACTSCFF